MVVAVDMAPACRPEAQRGCDTTLAPEFGRLQLRIGVSYASEEALNLPAVQPNGVVVIRHLVDCIDSPLTIAHS